ncbi:MULTISPECIES: methyltransferase domain-containing protein [unclassified Streptomyces]|uniref:Protein-L-isoaspartate O-methyltransferase n=1 Tax=Streptomyces sp. NBC_00060 TaxID=2975636 RepID=A0AAU2H6P4_9ACTN
MKEQHLAHQLAQQLTTAGKLSGPWRAAYEAVPRRHFIPDVAWVKPDGPAPGYSIDRDQDELSWLRAVYSDASIVTQLDGGTGDLRTGKGTPTSSCSAPGIVFTILKILDARDADRVLDVGTGTGWTASLLSHRVGSQNVVSVEVDTEVAAQAADNINAAGYAPRLVVDDGGDGHPEAAPYDRIHATCAVERVPYAWVRDTRPGGVIVAPWTPAYGHGLLARLVVTSEDQAIGRFPTTASFMLLRSQQQSAVWSPHHNDKAHESTTRLDPRSVAVAPAGADLFITAMAPGITAFPTPDADGGFSLLLVEADNPGGAWAAADYVPGASAYTVTWFGDRNLWDEIAAAYLTWVAAGQPERDRFGMTVSPHGQHLWLDQPQHVLGPPG